MKEKGLAVHRLPEKLPVLEELPTLADNQKVDKRILINNIIEKLKAEGHI